MSDKLTGWLLNGIQFQTKIVIRDGGLTVQTDMFDPHSRMTAIVYQTIESYQEHGADECEPFIEALMDQRLVEQPEVSLPWMNQ